MTDLNTLDYVELERLAYISGQPALASLYAKAAKLEAIDVDEIKEAAFNSGYKAGKRAASDAELLEEISNLKAKIESLNTNQTALFTSYANFLKWLQTEAAKQITNRKEAIKRLERQIVCWRS